MLIIDMVGWALKMALSFRLRITLQFQNGLKKISYVHTSQISYMYAQTYVRK